MVVNMSKLIKYLIIALLLAAVLKHMPDLNLSDEAILEIVLLFVVFILIVDTFIPRRENMRVTSPMMEGRPCKLPYKIPRQYKYNSGEEDHIQTGLNYNMNLPGYYLINNGMYAKGVIPNDKLGALIRASKLNDLYNQHNFNLIWQPEALYGKDRGYLGWDKPDI